MLYLKSHRFFIVPFEVLQWCLRCPMSREVCSDISDGLWFVAGRGTMTINDQERKQPCRPPPHGHPINTKSNGHHHECLGYGRQCLRRRFSHQGGHHHRRGRAQVSVRPAGADMSPPDGRLGPREAIQTHKTNATINREVDGVMRCEKQ